MRYWDGNGWAAPTPPAVPFNCNAVVAFLMAAAFIPAFPFILAVPGRLVGLIGIDLGWSHLVLRLLCWAVTALLAIKSLWETRATSSRGRGLALSALGITALYVLLAIITVLAGGLLDRQAKEVDCEAVPDDQASTTDHRMNADPAQPRWCQSPSWVGRPFNGRPFGASKQLRVIDRYIPGGPRDSA